VRTPAKKIACLLTLALAAAGCGAGGSSGTTTPSTQARTIETAKTTGAAFPPATPRRASKAAAEEAKEPPHSKHLGGLPKPGRKALNRARHPEGPAATVADYVRALDGDAGRRVCDLFEPGALDSLKLPKQAGGCAGSMSASIGYADPRGYPVFAGSTLEAVRSVAIDGRHARVTATVRTTFADNRGPSIEDDVIYMARQGRRWLIVKPSATIYFAIGAREAPLSSVSPPDPSYPSGG
jgi:hypothetical protein